MNPIELPRCERCGRALSKDVEGTICPACQDAAAAPVPAIGDGDGDGDAAEAEREPEEDAAPAPQGRLHQRARELEAGHEGESVPTHGAFHGHRIPVGEEPRWIDRPENVTKLVRVFWAVCALVLLVDLLDLAGVLYHKHPHFPWERLPGFYGIYGFVACVLLVLLAKQLRQLVMREQEYFDA